LGLGSSTGDGDITAKQCQLPGRGGLSSLPSTNYILLISLSLFESSESRLEEDKLRRHYRSDFAICQAGQEWILSGLVGLSLPIVSRLKTPIGETTSHLKSSAELWKSFDATLHARVCLFASLNGALAG